MSEVLCQGEDIGGSGAIVCKHVARQGSPILFACRDNPVRDVDTGWQFLCGDENHGSSEAEVWCVAHVLEHDPSVADIIDNPTCRAFIRSDGLAPWRQCEYEAHD